MNPKVLSIPPYLSTPWKHVFSLHLKETEGNPLLVVTLQNRRHIEIPNLSRAEIEELFAAHALSQENESTPTRNHVEPLLPLHLGFSLQSQHEGPKELFGSALEHNSQFADLPALPSALLEKLKGLVQALGLDRLDLFPKAEPNCNCFSCQIVQLLTRDSATHPAKETAEEEIVDADLHFRTWDIRQTSEKLYLVSNPLDSKEHYSVFLGEPIGCTCGQKNCEHIRAVLNT